MRTVQGQDVTDAVAKAVVDANTHLGQDMLSALDWGLKNEESETGREILTQIRKNAEIAANEGVPYCQDCGFAVFFVEQGQDVRVEGNLHEALNEGVRRGYKDGYLRKSIVKDPLRRVNTGDNTPAVIHHTIVPGDGLRILFGAKGGGSENMSRQAMLKPADGADGVKDFVIETVSIGGANACPPLILGVGVGGTFEYSAVLAKRAALRPVGSQNPDPFYAEMEAELKKRSNALGIGPMGLGGRVTVLDVHVEAHPCHIASLPVAVNVQCHADRHREINL